MSGRALQASGAASLTRLVVAAALPVLLLVLVLALAGGCSDDNPPLAVDRQPPAAIAWYPSDGAVAVAPDTAVWVQFSEPVEIDRTGGRLPLRVEDAHGQELVSQLRLDATGTRVILTPSSPFAIGAEFRMVLSAVGLADLAGNPPADTLAARFTTGLAFHDIGRIFSANEIGRDVRAFDVLTYEEVAESPVSLGVRPQRMHAEPAEGAVYVLYTDGLAGGVLVIDGRTLGILRDSGPVLADGLSDLTVVPDAGLVLVLSPADAAMLVLDSTTLAPARAPVAFDRPDAGPVRIELAARLGLVVVGLEGGGRITAYRLPDLRLAAGFPVRATADICDLAVDEDQGLAWVGGGQRYAVVDLFNPARTESFQIPVAACRFCAPQLWRLLLAPGTDRVIFMNRRQSLAAVVRSTYQVAPESPGDLGLGSIFLTDVVQNPRSRDLVLLGWRSLDTPLYLADARTLDLVPAALPFAGDKAVDLEVLP